jgi:hypothetical protein
MPGKSNVLKRRTNVDNKKDDMYWAEGPYNDGAEARIVAQAPIAACPNPETIGQFAVDSWKAGWRDADRQLTAEKPAWDRLPAESREISA